jgi:hypothetical protein
MKLDLGRPMSDEGVMLLVAKVLSRDPSGCCLHIVLDDGNTDDSHVEFCRKYADECGHDDCVDVADALLGITQSNRESLYARSWQTLKNVRHVLPVGDAAIHNETFVCGCLPDIKFHGDAGIVVVHRSADGREQVHH